MATCIASLFEIQKEQKRTATVVCRPTKKVVPCRQSIVLDDPKKPADKRKSLSWSGLDIEFILQYASIVAPKFKDSLIDALISNKENINPNSEIYVLSYNTRRCPCCSTQAPRPSENCGVFCTCGHVWCWRCELQWDPCHMECNPIPNLTAEDIESYVNMVTKPAAIRKQPKVAKREPKKEVRAPFQLLR